MTSPLPREGETFAAGHMLHKRLCQSPGPPMPTPGLFPVPSGTPHTSLGSVYPWRKPILHWLHSKRPRAFIPPSAPSPTPTTAHSWLQRTGREAGIQGACPLPVSLIHSLTHMLFDGTRNDRVPICQVHTEGGVGDGAQEVVHSREQHLPTIGSANPPAATAEETSLHLWKAFPSSLLCILSHPSSSGLQFSPSLHSSSILSFQLIATLASKHALLSSLLKILFSHIPLQLPALLCSPFFTPLQRSQCWSP